MIVFVSKIRNNKENNDLIRLINGSCQKKILHNFLLQKKHFKIILKGLIPN